MEVDQDGDGDDVEEEVEDLDDLSMLDRLSVHNDVEEEGNVPFDDTRDSDDETDGSVDPEPNYDPDDPDYDHYMYASQCSLHIYSLSSVLIGLMFLIAGD